MYLSNNLVTPSATPKTIHQQALEHQFVNTAPLYMVSLIGNLQFRVQTKIRKFGSG